MDFNKILSAHQIALIRAADAHDAHMRQHRKEQADRIADHISKRQQNAHVHAVPLMPAATL